MECTVMILWCSLIMGMILVLLRTFVHSTDKRLDNLNRSDHLWTLIRIPTKTVEHFCLELLSHGQSDSMIKCHSQVTPSSVLLSRSQNIFFITFLWCVLKSGSRYKCVA